MIGDKLVQILVVSHDHDIETGAFSLSRERADDIVGFEARFPNNGNSQRLAQPLDVRKLQSQIVGHLRASCLVAFIGVVTKRAFGPIECHAEVIRFLGRDQLAQHHRETVDGVRGKAARI